jgi:hypothetical protein
MMVKQKILTPQNLFCNFICDNCGKPMGQHFVFRPEKFADVRPDGRGRKPDGKHYCHSDGVAYSTSHHQRVLRRIMVEGYENYARE